MAGDAVVACGQAAAERMTRSLTAWGGLGWRAEAEDAVGAWGVVVGV